MAHHKALAAGLAIVALVLTSVVAQAQTRGDRARAQATARTPAAAPAEPPDCLRALFDGKCTNPAMVEAAGVRSIIVPSVRVSYFGTPAGTIGGDYIPFERFFRDNDVVFGLPTFTCAACNVVRRTK